MKKRVKRKAAKQGKESNLLHLIPRILAILFILFISMFALDVFMEGYGFWQIILALFMHLIPSLILIAVLVLVWRNGLVLGLLFILWGLWYIVRVRGPLSWYVTIAGPAFLVGIFFILEWMLKRKKK